jgi:hypothetical protein
MFSLVLDGDVFSVPTAPLFSACRIFQTNPSLLAKPYHVQSRCFSDSFRVFLSAIGGAEATITSDNVYDLGRLCGELEFTAFGKQVEGWQSSHAAIDAGARRDLAVLKAAMAEQLRRQEREIGWLRQEAEQQQQASGSRRQSEEREAQAVADVQKALGQAAARLEEESGRQRFAGSDAQRANEQLRAEAAGLRLWIESLEGENLRLSKANELLARDLQEVSDCCQKANEDLGNLGPEVARLREEIKVMQPRPEPLAPPKAGNPFRHWLKQITVGVIIAVMAVVTGLMAIGLARPSPSATPPRQEKRFRSWIKKGGNEAGAFDVPDGIIGHLTRVHAGNVVKVTSGSFEKETEGANPHSGVYGNRVVFAATNAVDLDTDSCFLSAHRTEAANIAHTRNNWLCYDFGQRRIVPTHYTIRTAIANPGDGHLKSWLIETSTDGERWWEVAREEENEQLNGPSFTGTFAVADGRECRFIRLVNIGRNHCGDDGLLISAWEIFGRLID